MCTAIAHMKPRSSRATAVAAFEGGLPDEGSFQYRAGGRWSALGGVSVTCSLRPFRGALEVLLRTAAGSFRGRWVVAALVMPALAVRAPLEYSLGVSPE